MIDWEQFLVALPLALPEVLVAGLILMLLIRRGVATTWVAAPIAALGLSAALRFVPIFCKPIQDFLNDLSGPGPEGLMVIWYGDMLLRLLAWTGLLYGLFWRRHAPPPPAASAPP